ncbi:hypothetical protein JTE90_015076 [Oedothorax gibbosus]|uniref:Uncharacterized protein n=1 Tax=Oedothorax gibbosus TaxID=931172 RepID=A0AAV6VQF9_9ARAC|nr:hypothetical protein JTE90_015076 [Oedothorax gibbosus]
MVSGRSRFNCDFLSMSSGTTQEVVVYFWWDSVCDTAGHLYSEDDSHLSLIHNEARPSHMSWWFVRFLRDGVRVAAGTEPREDGGGQGARSKFRGGQGRAFPPHGPPRITSGFVEFNPREVVVSCVFLSISKMWFGCTIGRMGINEIVL